jgi:hypothetical protein
LVGTLAGTDYTAMGDVVNTASRLQAEAPPGGVLVGEATHALTDGVIDYGPATGLRPRGREQSISTWLAVDTLTAPGARLRRSDLRLVGRDPELMLARAALALGVREQRSLLLNVVGESGVGKSRLIDELLDTLDDVDALSALVLEGACAPYGESNVWSPIAGAMASHLDFDVSLTIEQIRERATAKAAKLVAADVVTADVERVVEVFVHLLGHPSALDSLDPPTRRDAVHHGITKVIEHLARRSPLLLWIDDLHWADEVVIDLLQHLIGSVQRLPFIIITSMRPGSDVLWPPATDRATVLSLTVQPLARRQRRTGARAAQRDARRQRCRSTAARRTLRPQRWQPAVPPATGGRGRRARSVQRVARLAPSAHRCTAGPAEPARTSSARQRSHSRPVRQHRCAGTVRAQDAATVRAVDRSPRSTPRVSCSSRWSLAVRSDSVRETVPDPHQAVACWRHAGVYAPMSQHAPTALDDIAHHSATAAELVAEIGVVDGVPSTIRAEAVEALTVAAHRARDSGSHRLTVRHSTRAIELMTGHPSEAAARTQLMLLRSAGLIELRDWTSARADLDVLLERAVRDADVATEGAARRLLGSMYHQQGDPDGAGRARSERRAVAETEHRPAGRGAARARRRRAVRRFAHRRRVVLR